MIPHFLSKITVACVYSIAKMQKQAEQADSLPNTRAHQAEADVRLAQSCACGSQ
jgi:hypothetical protein